ncbi:DUF4190 domain-containing protein [Candidatus Pacearchaeota archaeon]|nr:DUF4190 domain-containing protein [Candidatus Pacearchaeota archaeon]
MIFYSIMRGYSNKSIISISLGILSLWLLWIVIISVPLAILAVIFGFIALKEIRKSKNKIEGRTLAIIGLVTGIISLLNYILIFLI